jgi:predicted small secreted protein
MKIIISIILVGMLSACGTAGGLVAGAGSDLQKAGEWIKSK